MRGSCPSPNNPCSTSKYSLLVPLLSCRMSRDCHGYAKTHQFEVMGFAGTGMVVNFSTPQHTVYLYCSIVGIPRIYYSKVSIIFIVLKLVFSHIFSLFFIVSHHDTTKYGYTSHTSSFLFGFALYSHSYLTSKP
jgi:hypothetical protein